LNGRPFAECTPRRDAGSRDPLPSISGHQRGYPESFIPAVPVQDLSIVEKEDLSVPFQDFPSFQRKIFLFLFGIFPLLGLFLFRIFPLLLLFLFRIFPLLLLFLFKIFPLFRRKIFLFLFKIFPAFPSVPQNASDRSAPLSLGIFR